MLLLVVVLLAVLSLLAAAAMSFSRSELGAVKNERSGDELLACADAGRQYMLARFDVTTGSPMELKAVNVNLNADITKADVNCPESANVPADAKCMRSGHLGQMSVTGVTKVESNAGGSLSDMRDTGNMVGAPMLGGVPHKVTVHCLDENGRGTEVEFVVKFGV
ncbi:hypothetical protein BON30_02655 [Cystobacter ferrugineus]|uniref:Pilus assembly protein PilX n=1 Tax=Cystobacter ferrugineus TaxID=83449 RepID=A0A1L9BIV2_9BACT|nr:hypothetical protein BON30_02655 [Cystobacter ferrugineus]